MPEDRAKAIGIWLSDPAARYFIEWVSNQSAGFAAEAGNKLVEGEDSDVEDAKRLAAKARRYLSAFEIMAECYGEKFKFQIATFREKPLSTDQQ